MNINFILQNHLDFVNKLDRKHKDDNTYKPKICFITAIYGNYESSCKQFKKQNIDSDFICFTDNKNIQSNGWIIDTTPYHFLYKSKLDNPEKHINSLDNNKHTFNVAKYYKQAFKNIPRLSSYDIVVWLDGTIQITSPNVSQYILNNIYQHKIITWSHEHRFGILKDEVKASNYFRYTSTFWNNQKQPYQDINKQYDEYISLGYSDSYFKNMNHPDKHFGVWITCFVAFLQHDERVKEFLDLWYEQTLKYTTQDQIGFPFVCQKTRVIPLTLPDGEIKGVPHTITDFYIKHVHGI